MKNMLSVFIASSLCIYSSCSSYEYIITDSYAYSSNDDSVDVASQYKGIIHSDNIPANKDSIREITIPPKPIYTVAGDYPIYSFDLLYNKNYIIEGEVWVRMYINSEGIVYRVFITKSSHPIFNKPTLDAAVQWRFSPAYLDGKPMNSFVIAPFKYRYKRE